MQVYITCEDYDLLILDGILCLPVSIRDNS